LLRECMQQAWRCMRSLLLVPPSAEYWRKKLYVGLMEAFAGRQRDLLLAVCRVFRVQKFVESRKPKLFV